MVTRAPLGRVERDSARLAAGLLLAGVLVTAIAGFLHPEGADPNDHRTIFAIYAASQSWTAVHLGQFIGMRVDPLRRSDCNYRPGFARNRLSHGALRPLLPSAGMDPRQQRILGREPDPHSLRNRSDPRVDRLACGSCPPNEDRSASRDHIRRNDLVHASRWAGGRVDAVRRLPTGVPPTGLFHRLTFSSPLDLLVSAHAGQSETF